ncbi:MAG: patatin-like phospholipase family protein [Chloroflexota bacterium]
MTSEKQPIDSAPPPFVSPLEECDLVMKGGITSGVVYPRAVIELARRQYRFRSIGGTSAGAIAAAVTAAAEYGRLKQGFEKLERVAEQLSRSGFLANLFQPAPQARPLLNIFIEFLERRRPGVPPPPAPPGKPAIRWLLSRLGQNRPTAELLLALVSGHAADSVASGAQRGAGLGARYGALGAGLVTLAAALVALLVCLLAGVPVSPGLLAALAASVVVLAALGAWAGQMIGTDIGAAAQVGRDGLAMLRDYVPGKMYGICAGRSVPGHAESSVIKDETGAYVGLTDWLADTIDDLAGLPPRTAPLTFRHLRYHKLPDGADVGITLRMVTTNLTQRQPYVVPFENDLFLFSEQEMAKLFPDYVVRHLILRARRSQQLQRRFAGVTGEPLVGPGQPAEQAQRDWYIPYDDGVEQHRLRFLPAADDLPVVFAMRMSLSFPVLLSAVPLWSISGAAFAEQEQLEEATRARRSASGAEDSAAPAEAPLRLEPRHLQRNWFSDGGICSNFPIHFFDKWFPPRPTFGINLDQLPEQVRPNSRQVLDYVGGQPEQQHEEGERDKYTSDVYMPRSYPRDWLGARWNRIERDLPGFLRAILDTSLNYRDTMQSLLPSYSDRIVTVRLTKQEGGLNLNMDPETIRRISQKGARAGQEILSQFNLQHHQWVRLRLLLNELEEQLTDLRRDIRLELPAEEWNRIEEQLSEVLKVLSLEQMPEVERRATNLVQQLITDELAAGESFPYARRRPLTPQESLRLNLLLVLIELWGREPGGVFRRDGPHTRRLTLRVTPEL